MAGGRRGAQVDAFMADCAARYGVKFERLGGFRSGALRRAARSTTAGGDGVWCGAMCVCAGLAKLAAEGVRAVFLGTRESDPDGGVAVTGAASRV